MIENSINVTTIQLTEKECDLLFDTESLLDNLLEKIIDKGRTNEIKIQFAKLFDDMTEVLDRLTDVIEDLRPLVEED